MSMKKANKLSMIGLTQRIEATEQYKRPSSLCVEVVRNRPAREMEAELSLTGG